MEEDAEDRVSRILKFRKKYIRNLRHRASCRSAFTKEGIMRGSFVLVTVIAATLFISPQVRAKTFYLKNGEQIDYQSYRQKDGRIFVRINRDTEVDFSPEEVDLKKTEKDAKQEKKVRTKKGAHHHKPAVKKAPKVEQKKGAPSAKPAPAAAKPAPAAAKPGPAAAKPVPAAAKTGPAANPAPANAKPAPAS